MVKFSCDVDILKVEPILFGELHLPWQVLAGGTGAVLTGTTLTASDTNFESAGVSAGGVVYLNSADRSLDGAYEIAAVDSATQLTVSVLRSDAAAAPIAPHACDDLTYRISTLDPQAGEAAFQLTEYFGIQPGSPTSEITADDVVDTQGLRRASAYAVIAGVYAMWAGRTEGDTCRQKSVDYAQRSDDARQRCRLHVDLGSDGVIDGICMGGAFKLVRD